VGKGENGRCKEERFIEECNQRQGHYEQCCRKRGNAIHETNGEARGYCNYRHEFEDNDPVSFKAIKCSREYINTFVEADFRLQGRALLELHCKQAQGVMK